MIYTVLEYRDFLAEKVPKLISNLNFSSHLEDANPIAASLFFKNVWSKKYDLFKNNFLFRNEIFNLKKQVELAEFRLTKVEKGHQLELTDFSNFDNKSFFFREAQYLHETYYEDLEIFSDHFYPKNKESISESRDFAEQTLTKKRR